MLSLPSLLPSLSTSFSLRPLISLSSLFLIPPQHAMMLPVLTHHIRYHQCLKHLDDLIGYVFKERCLLQVRETHAHSQCSPIRAGAFQSSQH